MNPINRKVIYSFKDGVEQRFESIAEAAKKLNCIECNISMVVNGINSHHHGYKFRDEKGTFAPDYVHPATLKHEKRLQQKTRHCNFCNKTKPKDKFHSNEFTKCKLCVSKERGIKNIGQHKIHQKRLSAGKWKCTDCNRIKPITAFCKNRANANGFNHNCKECMNVRHTKKWKINREKLSDSYLNTWLLSNYNIPADCTTKQLRETARMIILARRETKRMFQFDGMNFSKREFAFYLEKKYGIDHHRTEGRINKGASENDCLIPEYEYRGMRAKPVILTDTKTGKEYKFRGTKEAGQQMRIGGNMLAECLRTGQPTRLYHTSKVKTTYIVNYDKQEIRPNC